MMRIIVRSHILVNIIFFQNFLNLDGYNLLRDHGGGGGGEAVGT